MLVVTTESLPGYEIRLVLGQVVSSLARTANPFREGVRQLRGGNYDPMAPENLTRWRTEVVARLAEEAQRLGANAVVAMRFDNRDCGQNWTELCAYGTAVVVLRQAPVELPPDQPAIAAETAQYAEPLDSGPIADSPSAPMLDTALETPTPDKTP